tara:strand:+ start:589 stop:1104 length:516 start_codon:yes stop_codon:yes gene_type:complete
MQKTMEQISLFTQSVFFIDQEDKEFKERVLKDDGLKDIEAFKKVLRPSLGSLENIFFIKGLSVKEASYCKDKKDESNLNTDSSSCLLRGVYFISAPEDSGFIAFHRRDERTLFNLTLQKSLRVPHPDFLTDFNFVPKDNTVLFFHDKMELDYTKNARDEERVYISFGIGMG